MVDRNGVVAKIDPQEGWHEHRPIERTIQNLHNISTEITHKII